MRPVQKGSAPAESARWREYKEARPYLVERLGRYCSYCERFIPTQLAVEHVHPRANGGAELDLDNFLLACVNCNSTKKDNNAGRDGYVWPDRDNTFRAFRYDASNMILPADIPELQHLRGSIEDTINLLGLNAHHNKDSDHRLSDRSLSWGMIQGIRAEYDSVRDEEKSLCIQLVNKLLASNCPHWSIWMTVFADVPEIVAVLLEMTGTARDCFESQNGRCSPVARAGGQC